LPCRGDIKEAEGDMKAGVARGAGCSVRNEGVFCML
jgi:hypothetical protein